MRLNTKLTALIFTVILFGGIAIAGVVGVWVTESYKQPELIKEGEFAGMSDPGDIRGSYSFGDIAEVFDVTPDILAEAFGIETDKPEAFQCKMLEEYYPGMPEDMELGTGAVKQFVAIYTGLPYEGEDVFRQRLFLSSNVKASGQMSWQPAYLSSMSVNFRQMKVWKYNRKLKKHMKRKTTTKMKLL